MATLQDILATVAGGLAGTSKPLARGIRSASDVFNAIQRKRFLDEREETQEAERVQGEADATREQLAEQRAQEQEAARVGGIRNTFLEQLSQLPEGDPRRVTLEAAIRGSKTPGRFSGTLLDLFKPEEAPAPPKPRTGTVFDPERNQFVFSEDIQPGQVIRPGPRPPTVKEEASELEIKEKAVNSQKKLIDLQKKQNAIIQKLQTPSEGGISPLERKRMMEEARIIGEQMAIERQKLGLQARAQAEEPTPAEETVAPAASKTRETVRDPVTGKLVFK